MNDYDNLSEFEKRARATEEGNYRARYGENLYNTDGSVSDGITLLTLIIAVPGVIAMMIYMLYTFLSS